MKNKKKWFLATFCFQLFFLGFEAGGLQQVVQKIGVSFHTTQTLLGSLIALQYLAMLFCPIISGRIADRHGKKWVSIISVSVFILGCVLIIATKQFLVLGLGIFCCGVGYSVGESTGTAAISDFFSGDSLRQISLSQVFFSLGGIVSPMLIEFLMDRVGMDWRILFYILGAANLAIATPVMLFYPSAGTEKAQEHFPRKAIDIRRFFVPQVLLLVIAMFVSSGLENGFCYYADLYAISILNAPALTAKALSLYWFLNVVIRLLFSFIHRWNRRIILLCLGGAAISLVLLAVLRTGFSFILLTALIGIFTAPMYVTFMNQAIEQFPESSATLAGIMYIPSGLGAVSLLILSGRLSDTLDVRVVFVCIALIALIGFLVYRKYCIIKEKESTAGLGAVTSQMN